MRDKKVIITVQSRSRLSPFCVEESGSSGSRRNAYWPSVMVSGLYEC